jgi:hypothetical protein
MKASIYLGEPLRAALSATGDDESETGNRSGRINNIAERYNEIITSAMPEFTKGEWCAIFDANNGGMGLGGLRDIQLGWANVADSPEMDEKWSIDHIELARRMRDLSLVGKIAVGEATERFWGHYQLPTDEALAKAGVRITGS